MTERRLYLEILHQRGKVDATLANRALLFRSSCRTVLDPSLTRAPVCHLVRECFRFRRPKGNNPSFRPLDHVEDRVSFAEYYGFLYSDMYVCRVHSTYMYRMYMCKSDSPTMQSRHREWKSYGSSASTCKCLVVWNCGNEMHETLSIGTILCKLSLSSTVSHSRRRLRGEL